MQPTPAALLGLPQVSRPRAKAVRPLLAVLCLLAPESAWAASTGAPAPGLVWGLPFVGILLSIALIPISCDRAIWHRLGYPKLALG